MTKISSRRRRLPPLLIVVTIFALMGGLVAFFVGPLPIRFGLAPAAPAGLAANDWQRETQDLPHPGVTRWRSQPDSDGTLAELVCFDFASNPGLRLEIYDQDEDDAKPFDNSVQFWERGVMDAAAHLNSTGRGEVVAAWNGLFFATEGKTMAHHVGPVVINGKTRLSGLPRHRWTFGVRYDRETGKPRFLALHQPPAAEMSRRFDFAADAAQCLVRNGKPLALQPFPIPGAPPVKQPVASTPAEAGHIPIVDHMRTTRVSLGWTENSDRLYLLFVKEPDSETASIYAHRYGIPLAGGWTVADVQRFWLRRKVWGAINSDGGDLAQFYLRGKDGDTLYPPRWSRREMRLEPAPSQSPRGGSLMYFYVRDAHSR
ncbi:MAG: hypothetical protein H8F28_12165 [Fibrella sp.]|nr:hypothetical protein [Armatimonadota bacterium]